MNLVFSRDRPAQLDLLLRSIDRYTEPESTQVIWYASTNDFKRGYSLILDGEMTPEDRFDTDLREALAVCPDETITFFCDDDIVFRKPDHPPADLLTDQKVLTVSLWLGRGNVKQPLPKGFPLWRWVPLPRHDFGFPCALDGNVYRVADVLRLIGSDGISGPTNLETVLAMRIRIFARERPLMACFPDQCVVGVPVNRVSVDSGVPYGRTFPQTTERLNQRFLAGERIDLDRLNFSDINSLHHEIKFVWS